MNVIDIYKFKKKQSDISLEYDGVNVIITWKNTGRQIFLSKDDSLVIRTMINIVVEGK